MKFSLHSVGEDCLGQCLYVAGVPGTGKTATVQEVMRQLRGRMDRGDLPPFRYVEINALRLPSPQHAYVQLYRVSLPSLLTSWLHPFIPWDINFPQGSHPLRPTGTDSAALWMHGLALV